MRDGSVQERGAIRGIVLFAVVKFFFHLFLNHRYGFHRDELQTLADARHLEWGYVVYPPLTPFLGRIELMLFGTSLAGFRSFAVLGQCVVIVLAALIAKRLGGSRTAQWLTAILVAISPISLAASSLFQYVSFDILWWVLIAYGVASVCATDDGRWWLLIGGAIGLGVLTKYSIAFLVAGVVLAVLATDLRRHLRERWLWLGALLSLAIAAPNLWWQYQHDFASLDFLRHIHERDVRIGRTDGFLKEQLFLPSSPASIPFWAAGVIALFTPRFRKFRAVGIMAVVPFVLFVLAEGRSYYTGGIFPALVAAGAVVLTEAVMSWRPVTRRAAFALIGLVMVASSSLAFIVVPLAPVGSRLWEIATEVNGDFREELGWEELTAEVARIWNTLPPAERSRTAIFGTNYGEAGAIELYGERYGLPTPISGANAFWDRGYGDGTATTVIILGQRYEEVADSCQSVTLAGRITNRYGVQNEESRDHPDIFLCRGLKMTWQEIWPAARSFG